jgi:hypothetical protein
MWGMPLDRRNAVSGGFAHPCPQVPDLPRAHNSRQRPDCYRCRPSRRLHVEGDKLYISGIGHLSHDAALQLASAIADALEKVTPS